MREYIEERAVEIANYIIENNATVRQTAKQFRISKSTVHKDVTERLLNTKVVLFLEFLRFASEFLRSDYFGYLIRCKKCSETKLFA